MIAKGEDVQVQLGDDVWKGDASYACAKYVNNSEMHNCMMYRETKSMHTCRRAPQ